MRGILLGLFLLSSAVWAEGRAFLKSMESGTETAGFVTTLNFDRDFSPQTLIDYQSNYVQIDLKGQGVTSKREVRRVSDPLVQSVVLSQFAPDVIRTRFILKDKTDPSLLRGRITTQNEGSTVRVTLAPMSHEEEKSEIAEEAQSSDLKAAEELTEAKPESPEQVLAKELNTTESAQTVAKVSSGPILAKSEHEIPVLAQADKKVGVGKDPMTRLFFSLAVIAVVAAGLLLFGRYWAKRKSGLPHHHQIKMLTQFALGPKKSLAIIRVAGESILIGVTDHNISMIKSLALLDEDVPMEVPQNFAGQMAESQVRQEAGDREEFSFGGVKDVVASRLREMRSL